MSTVARHQILARLKAVNPQPKNTDHLPFTPWGSEGQISEEEKLTRFCQLLRANHADVQCIPDTALADTLKTLAKEKGWQRAAIGTAGRWHAAFQQGLSQLDVSEFAHTIDTWKTELFTQVDVGLTHVLAGIADTGSLVLWPSEHEPRTLSLVPPCHVAVMHRASLCCHFLEVIETQHWAAGMPTNALLISGPSKTADIQQTLAYGAHGPAELIVLILEENT